jgi:hypothetical protein
MHHAPNLITDPSTALQILASLLQNSGEQRPVSLFFRSPNRRRPRSTAAKRDVVG